MDAGSRLPRLFDTKYSDDDGITKAAGIAITTMMPPVIGGMWDASDAANMGYMELMKHIATTNQDSSQAEEAAVSLAGCDSPAIPQGLSQLSINARDCSH